MDAQIPTKHTFDTSIYATVFKLFMDFQGQVSWAHTFLAIYHQNNNRELATKTCYLYIFLAAFSISNTPSSSYLIKG